MPIDFDSEFSPEITALCLDQETQTDAPDKTDACAAIDGAEWADLRAAVIQRRLQHRFTATFTAKASGELFLYVSDALLAPSLPWAGAMYDNNRGRARVDITRLAPLAGSQPRP